MSYQCKILADSLGPHGHRLTTFEVTFPRIVLAQIRTHRMLSFSVESSRAVPLERRIEDVMNNPYIPEFLERAKGMGGGRPLTGAPRTLATSRWLAARDANVEIVRQLAGTSKQHAGRLLEPFSWVSAIISGTSFENFFSLRCDDSAQPEMQTIAQIMRKHYNFSEPKMLLKGEWHLPLVTAEEKRQTKWAQIDSGIPAAPAVSAGRCASVSYARHHSDESWIDAFVRWNDRLLPFKHWSPAEHPAQCLSDAARCGNFIGWRQLRKFYRGESGEKSAALRVETIFG